MDCLIMKDKTCLITGSTNGHGKALAKRLARMGAHVIIHGRDANKCLLVQKEIEDETGNKPELLICNLASQRSIKQACIEFLASGRPLHLLINNAGLVSHKRAFSDDGLELNFAVNYLAPFLLTRLLLDRIIASAPARIVNVASGAHMMSTLDLNDLEGKKKRYFIMGAYGRSKLALTYFNIELAKRLAGKGVTVNAVDPGPIASGIAKKPLLIARLADVIIQRSFPGADKAAETAFYLAVAKELEGVTGKYYRFMQPKEPKLDPRDPDFGKKLWDLTAAMIKV